jgi:hypothetical protein
MKEILMKKQIAMVFLTLLIAASALAAKPSGAPTRELTYPGLPAITYVSNSDGSLAEVKVGGKQIVSYDWTTAPYAVPMRFFNRWTVITSVLPDGSASQQIMDSHGAQHAPRTVLPHGRQFPRPAVVLDAFAADLGLSGEWQQGMEATPAGEVRLPANGKIVTIRYHAIGEGVRVAESDGKPLLWDIDLPLGASGRLGQLVPSRLIVTSTGAVQLAADIPFVDGIESIWTNDASASHVSFRTPRADATAHGAGLRPHAEMMVVCGYTEFDSCWDVYGGAVCDAHVYLSYCDDGGGSGYTPPPGDGSGGGPGGGTGTGNKNQITDILLHAAVDAGKLNASTKLQAAQCQSMIKMLQNEAGISLWDVMTSYAPDASSYLSGQVTFRDGTNVLYTDFFGYYSTPCADGNTKAWTWAPGVHEVQVCTQFKQLDTNGAGAAVIHEMLHTLGLPEYPSGYTSGQITAMVNQWCP